MQANELPMAVALRAAARRSFPPARRHGEQCGRQPTLGGSAPGSGLSLGSRPASDDPFNSLLNLSIVEFELEKEGH